MQPSTPLPKTYLFTISLAEFQDPARFPAAHAAMLKAVKGYGNLVTVFRSGCLNVPVYEVWGDPYG